MRTTGKYVLCAAALILLIVVIVFVNLPAKQAAVSGAAVGEELPDFSAECTDGGTFSLREQRGKVVVINLWATWCAPCVEELPRFDRLQREHSADVAVLAVHVPPVTADVADYLSAYACDIPFTVDKDGSLSAALNASTVLPQTIILDPDGFVTYNQPGALSYETLLELCSAAKEG